MKSTMVPILFVAAMVWVCNAQNQPAAPTHKPNAGHVGDAQTAEDIGRFVLSQLLAPHDFSDRTVMHNAALKDGVWIVHFSGGKTRIAVPIVIQIRQKTGAIIKYEDPAG
jgi:hypothetical protein